MAAAPPATRGPRPRRPPPRRGQSGSASGRVLRAYAAPRAGGRIGHARIAVFAGDWVRFSWAGGAPPTSGGRRFSVVAVLHIGQAVAGRNRFGFTVLGVGERVVATVDRGVSVDTDQLVPELDGRLRQRLEGADEVGFEGSWVRPYRR